MVVELDPAVRTTRDWEGPLVAPRVAAALEAALTPLDDDLSIDASLATLSRPRAVVSSRKEKAKGKYVSFIVYYCCCYCCLNFYFYYCCFWYCYCCGFYIFFFFSLLLLLLLLFYYYYCCFSIFIYI